MLRLNWSGLLHLDPKGFHKLKQWNAGGNFVRKRFGSLTSISIKQELWTKNPVITAQTAARIKCEVFSNFFPKLLEEMGGQSGQLI